MPVMVTGGFRTVDGMLEALRGEELDVIGLGRPLIADPQAARRLLAGEIDTLPSPERSLHPFHILPWNNMQLERLGDGREPDLALTGDAALAAFAALERANTEALLRHRRDNAGQ
jgi:hypothetical protein